MGPFWDRFLAPPKSRIYYGDKVPNRVRRYIRHKTSISTGSLPFSYLGVPLFKGSLRACHLGALADSVICKFAKQQGHTLSLAGRCCLINSVIASSLVHTMMIYKWPKSVLHRLEVAIRGFLWTGDIDKRGFSNVEQARCCSPINEGGFGLRSIRLANASFNCKLVWDILSSTDPVHHWLKRTYFYDSGIPRNVSRTFSVRSAVHAHVDKIRDGSLQLVGRHSKVKFWMDNWLGYRLSDKFNIPQHILTILTCSVGTILLMGYGTSRAVSSHTIWTLLLTFFRLPLLMWIREFSLPRVLEFLAVINHMICFVILY